MAGHVGVETEFGWSFHEKPHRHYELLGERSVPNVDGIMVGDGTTPDTIEILSVTQALGILDKSAPLQYYAARMTTEGACALLRRYGLERGSDGILPTEVDLEDLVMIAEDPKYLTKQLYRYGLMFSQKTDSAAKRGTAIHTVLEHWIDRGIVPNLDAYDKSWQGYVRALAAFLMSARPTFLESEMIVGSPALGVAGARDTVLVLRDPKRGRALIDLKTSKGVYPSSHFRQLTAYDRLGVECGEEPTDSQGILRVGPDGSWEIQWLQDFGTSDFFWGAFKNALAAARDERWIVSRGKAVEREARAAAKKAT